MKPSISTKDVELNLINKMKGDFSEFSKEQLRFNSEITQEVRSIKPANKAVFWANIANICIVVIAILALFYSIHQTNIMIKQTEAMTEQTKAMKKQTEIMSEQSMATNQELLRSHRPWLGTSDKIDIISPLTLKDGTAQLGIEFKLRNSGNSPAILANSHFHLIFNPSEYELIENPSSLFSDVKIASEDDLVKRHGGLIFAGDAPTKTIKFKPEFTKFDPKTKIRSIYMIIQINYKDEFNNSHYTQSVWQFKPIENIEINTEGVPVEGKFEVSGVWSAAI